MGKFDIYVRSGEEEGRLASIEHDFVDGSLYLTLVRENGSTEGHSSKFDLESKQVIDQNQVYDVKKVVKVSYHTSGVIKYHNLSNDRILGDPLYSISEKFSFIEYQINDIKKLIKKDPSENDIVLKIADKEKKQNYSFVFSISPEKSEGSISIEYYSGLFYLEVDIVIVDCFDERIMPFYYFTPSVGKNSDYPKNNACILFHQKLNETNDVIIYEADKSGIYTMIFHEKRRSIPQTEKMIEFHNPKYKAEFTTIREHYARFVVKDKKSGKKIIEKSALIKGLIFDNRL